MKKPTHILIFIYNSYKDPLFQNLLLSYVKTLKQKGNYRFDLVTFEQSEYHLSPLETEEEQQLLLQHNIHWHPQKFHTGKWLLLKKAVDAVQTILVVSKIKITHRPTYIFAFANVAAAYSIMLSKLLHMKLVVYSYEPHSEFMKELGLWKEKDLKYKVLSWLEKQAGIYAHVVLTGTKHGVNLLKEYKSKATLHRAPTAVDPDKFFFREDGRSKIRTLYDIENKVVFLYLGKFGGLYYQEELFEVFSEILNHNQNAFLLVVSSFDHELLKLWADKYGIPMANYSITSRLTDEEVKEYISAADIGISAVPPSPSQKFRSPTKVAEYLLCGLPYITCQGVSEDDDYARDHGVGVVLDHFSRDEIRKAHPRINQILTSNKGSLREKCRQIGLDYRSKERVDRLLLTTFK
ncbi:glycosyltransferase [Reichenbachiella sp. MSK19-1]|uniref:glycosyltransferase n=1 Tax=Reichenbachiella sp. MSK19-1 TaxID=1897631 RepID=UPI000E6BB4E1|nr:glycosyltransferase [Reichenbachiella sp. MSK19-1]RJE70860.1 hypothetical protein BGP76_08740 [Reichenbachiella sp. MSK19-1]